MTDVTPYTLTKEDPHHFSLDRSDRRQYVSVKRILVEISETCRTGSAGRCDW